MTRTTASGECVLVAGFATVRAAEDLLAELAPGYVAAEPHSEAWKAVFEGEGIARSGDDSEAGVAPTLLCVLGASMLAWSPEATRDDFAELRALAWKRGAEVLPGGVREREPAGLLFAIQARHAADAAQIVASAPAGNMMLAVRGDVVVGHTPLTPRPALTVAELRGLADGRALATQLISTEVGADVLLEQVHGPVRVTELRPRLSFQLASDDGTGLATALGAGAQVAGRLVIVEARGEERRRLAILGSHLGAHVDGVLDRRVAVHLGLWSEAGTPLDARSLRAEIDTELAAEFPAEFGTELEARACRPWPTHAAFAKDLVEAVIHTEDPAAIVRALAGFAEIRQLGHAAALREVDPAAHAIHALIDEVRQRSS